MTLIISGRDKAKEIAEMIGDGHRVLSSRCLRSCVWVSSNHDVRAVREAIALTSGRALVLSQFELGFTVGILCCISLLTVFLAAVPVGTVLSQLQNTAPVEYQADE